MASRALQCPYRLRWFLGSRKPRDIASQVSSARRSRRLWWDSNSQKALRPGVPPESFGRTGTLARWSGESPVSTVMTRATGSPRSLAVTDSTSVTARRSNFERGCWKSRDGRPGWGRPSTVRFATDPNCRRICRLSGQVLYGMNAMGH